MKVENSYQIDQKNEVSPRAFDHLAAVQEVSLQHYNGVRPQKTSWEEKTTPHNL